MAKTILLIDDEKDIVNIVRKKIQHAGYQAYIAYNGQEGLEAAESLHPHLILTDIGMPVMDGIMFYRELKNRPDLSHIPVIFATAYGSNETFAREMGAKDFLVKPFDTPMLLDKVGSFFVKQRAYKVMVATKMMHLLRTIVNDNLQFTYHLNLQLTNDQRGLVTDASVQKPDLIVLDVDLCISPSAAKVVRELRQQPALRETPILLMRSRMIDLRSEGGWADEVEINQCLANGASHHIGFLNKDSFLAMVKEYCK
jgi:CheY-like chemotaxis protein